MPAPAPQLRGGTAQFLDSILSPLEDRANGCTISPSHRDQPQRAAPSGPSGRKCLERGPRDMAASHAMAGGLAVGTGLQTSRPRSAGQRLRRAQLANLRPR